MPVGQPFAKHQQREHRGGDGFEEGDQDGHAAGAAEEQQIGQRGQQQANGDQGAPDVPPRRANGASARPVTTIRAEATPSGGASTPAARRPSKPGVPHSRATRTMNRCAGGLRAEDRWL